MSESYTFTVLGKPSGKARPRTMRVTKKTGEQKMVTHSPDPGWFQYNVRKAAQEVIPAPLEGSVFVEVIVERRIPKSWSKKRQVEAVGRYATAKPDASNVLSAVHDALGGGVAYQDDVQVAKTSFVRLWASRDATTITMEAL